MYSDATAGQNSADITAMSSAVHEQKKANNKWTFYIVGGVVALVIFFVALGFFIAWFIPK
tara:strand:- start:2401 stop:2580 length:180 start_codon:yes stop_codon:yes gene_type:complete